MPAHSGVPALVPPITPCSPLNATSQIATSAKAATSGIFRKLKDPWLAFVLMPCCQVGRTKLVLMPPPLSGQTVSADHGPPGLLVVNNVPPTTVRFGSSAGGTIVPIAKAPPSPEA